MSAKSKSNCTIKQINNEDIITIGQNTDTFPTFSNKYDKSMLGKFAYYSICWRWLTGTMFVYVFLSFFMCVYVFVKYEEYTPANPSDKNVILLFDFIYKILQSCFNKDPLDTNINTTNMYFTLILIYPVFFLIFDRLIMPFFRRNDYIAVYTFGLITWIISYLCIGIILPFFIFLIRPTLVYKKEKDFEPNSKWVFFIKSISYVLGLWVLNTYFVNQVVTNSTTRLTDMIHPFTKYYRVKSNIKKVKSNIKENK